MTKNQKYTYQNSDEKVLDIIYKTASTIADSAEEEKDFQMLTDKLVLAIAIRLKAEEFMLLQPGVEKNNKLNQTRELFNQYQAKSKDKSFIPTLRQVLIITPEFIHINAFMYESLIDDTPIEILRNLYKEITKLPSKQETLAHII